MVEMRSETVLHSIYYLQMVGHHSTYEYQCLSKFSHTVCHVSTSVSTTGERPTSSLPPTIQQTKESGIRPEVVGSGRKRASLLMSVELLIFLSPIFSRCCCCYSGSFVACNIISRVFPYHQTQEEERYINIHSGHNGPLISDMLPYCYIEFLINPLCR